MPAAGGYVVVDEVAHGVADIILKTLLHPLDFSKSPRILGDEIGISTNNLDSVNRFTEKLSFCGLQPNDEWKICFARGYTFHHSLGALLFLDHEVKICKKVSVNYEDTFSLVVYAPYPHFRLMIPNLVVNV